MSKVKMNHAAPAGPEGLLLAVIVTAVNDFADGNPAMRQDAAAYFSGPVYRDHLSWLGLPEHWQPVTIEND